MSLTEDDLEKIDKIFEAKLETKLKKSFEENNTKLIQLFFQHFPTKQEVEEIMDKKLVPINSKLSELGDIVYGIKQFIDTDYLILEKSVIDHSRRLDTLEHKLL